MDTTLQIERDAIIANFEADCVRLRDAAYTFDRRERSRGNNVIGEVFPEQTREMAGTVLNIVYRTMRTEIAALNGLADTHRLHEIARELHIWIDEELKIYTNHGN